MAQGNEIVLNDPVSNIRCALTEQFALDDCVKYVKGAK